MADDLFESKPQAPLAEALRPVTLDDVIGHERLRRVAASPDREATEARGRVLLGVVGQRRLLAVLGEPLRRVQGRDDGRDEHDHAVADGAGRGGH